MELESELSWTYIITRVELESGWNQTNIFFGGIGIGIELNFIDPESELNWNRLLPELHIIAKIDVVSLIIVRFSIRNHRLKAEKVSFPSKLLDMVLLELPSPLIRQNAVITHNLFQLKTVG